jgi:hypothetical protein
MSSDLTALVFIAGLAIVLPLVAWGILRFGRERPVDVALDSPEDVPAAVPKRSFRSGAAALLRQVRPDWPPNGDASDETDAVHSACVEISNRLFSELGQDAHKNGVWPADTALLAALRVALEEQRGNYAGYHVAYTLVRCGRSSPDIVKGLYPLRRMAFGWRDKGYTGARIEQMLRAAGIAPRLPAEAVARLDGWIADPLSALEQDSVITSLLFGTRGLIASLDDSGYQPRHDELFAKLAQAAVPAVAVTDVHQDTGPGERFKDVTATTYLAARDAPGVTAILSDAGSHWIVEYAHQGKAYGFLAASKGTWMDVDAVLRHFDEFMARLGHSDRVFRLANENDFWGHFVVAPGETFPALAQGLGIPLHGRA